MTLKVGKEKAQLRVRERLEDAKLLALDLEEGAVSLQKLQMTLPLEPLGVVWSC